MKANIGKAVTIAKAAALFHDIGKASLFWQKNVLFRKGDYVPVVRHEFMSTVLFVEYCSHHGLDFDALEPQSDIFKLLIAQGQEAERFTKDAGRQTLLMLNKVRKPGFSPLAQAIAYCIVTHHRLPVPDYAKYASKTLDPVKFFDKALPGNFLRSPLDEITLACIDDTAIRPNSPNCYDFCPKSFPCYTEDWKSAWRALDLHDDTTEIDALTLYLARALMISADHYVSKLDHLERDARCKQKRGQALYANTKAGSKGQGLLSHLLAVSAAVDDVARYLTDDEKTQSLRTITSAPLPASDNERFAWQDRAADKAQHMRSDTGAFCVCVASTGTGKTIGTYKVMQALCRDLRLTYAVGLRSLTRQTQKAYCAAIGLPADDVALIIGKQEHDTPEEAAALQEERGSDSADPSYSVSSDLICSPAVTCTIDQLMPAVEAVKGGSHIEPFLRIATSDLILDEIDDYGLTDMPAICRLVFLIGRLGRRLTVSSATLSPDIIHGLQSVYFAGQAASGYHTTPFMIYDENDCVCGEHTSGQSTFLDTYDAFITRKLTTLHKRFSGEIVPVPDVFEADKDPAHILATTVLTTCSLHHSRHCHTYREVGVSLGLVRITNVKMLFSVIVQLFQTPSVAQHAGRPIKFHILPYHAAMTRAQREATERALDEAMNRKTAPLSPALRALVDKEIASDPSFDHAFVAFASPVCETGRDIDADYAITEPSSMKSLIQLAGRVRRHRPSENPEDVCLSILSYPARFLTNVRNKMEERAAYIYPGFERNPTDDDKGRLLRSRNAHDALRACEYQGITSAPRIQKARDFDPETYLGDLEHAALHGALCSTTGQRVFMANLPARHPSFLLSGALSATQVFRFNNTHDVQIRYDQGARGDQFFQREGGLDVWQRTDTVLSVDVQETRTCVFWPIEDIVLPDGNTASLGLSGKNTDRFQFRFNRRIGFAHMA